MITLLIVLALVAVPLALIARLSLTVLARLLGVVSQSEVATRAEFARIREQLLATGGSERSARATTGPPGFAEPGVAATQPPDPPDRLKGAAREPQPSAATPAQAPAGSAPAQAPVTPSQAHWQRCAACAARVPSTASICLQCGSALSART